MSTFDEIIDKVSWGVRRTSQLPIEQIRVIAEAAFPQVNNQVAQEYAADENSRAVLRQNVSLVFAGGVITIPENVLRKYLRDATLLLSTGEIAAFKEPYADYLRTLDERLAYWSFNDLVLNAKNSAGNGGGVYVGAATLTCIASPAIPTAAGDQFIAPDDYTPDLIDALRLYVAGTPANQAAQETV